MACPANSLPCVSPQSLCLSFARFLTDGAIDFRSISTRFFFDFRSPETLPESPRSVPGASQNSSGTSPDRFAEQLQRNSAKSADGHCRFYTFGLIFEPGRSSKIDEKRARGRKSASGDGVGTDFCVFSRRCRSESVSGPIFGRSDP